MHIEILGLKLIQPSSITVDIKQDTTVLKNDTRIIKDDTEHLRKDTDCIIKEIQVLQTQVAGLDIQDGRGEIMRRFLAESITYAESGYSASTIDAEELRENTYEGASHVLSAHNPFLRDAQADPIHQHPYVEGSRSKSYSLSQQQQSHISLSRDIDPENKKRFDGVFATADTEAKGYITGDKAAELFRKSHLPEDTLAQIWELADVNAVGRLTREEFAVAMSLILQERIEPVFSPTIRKSSELGWDVDPENKKRFDVIFASFDTAAKGYVTGYEVGEFFRQSHLPEDTLAQIWDLADINSCGRLTKDEFAVALHLIRRQRVDRHASLPSTLPPSLVPPSMRKKF
jgi:Ca2+-binding EF-hand superfamily protein